MISRRERSVVTLILFISLTHLAGGQTTTAAPTTAATTQPSTATAPVPPAPQQQGPAVGSTGTVTDGNITDSALNEVCLAGRSNCTEPNSLCRDDGSNSGTSRCLCDRPTYAAYGNRSLFAGETQKCGLVLTKLTEPACNNCEVNKGICVKADPDPTFCQCPISRQGPDCSDVLVNVTCTKDGMTICYKPHEGVNLTDGWRMYVENKAKNAYCTGSLMTNASDTSCPAGRLKLQLSLTDLTTCGTTLSVGVANKVYTNKLVLDIPPSVKVNRSTVPKPFSFNTFCSFTGFQDRTFDGIGVGRINGNDRGEHVTPKSLTFTVHDRFGRGIPRGVSIRVGDKVSFKITMQRDGTYDTFSVERCTASTSPTIPDVMADTRPVINNGCPVPTEPTKDSWYIQQVPDSTNNNYILRTGPVPMFKLSGGDSVYVHCSLQLCITGDQSCKTKTKADCAAKGQGQVRRKRAAPNPDNKPKNKVEISTGVVVRDGSSPGGAASNTSGAFAAGSPGFIVVVLLSVMLAVVLAIAIVSLLVAMKKRRAAGRDQIPHQPQMFALPRIQNTHSRF